MLVAEDKSVDFKKFFEKKGQGSDPESERDPNVRRLSRTQRAIVENLFNPKGKRILDIGTGRGRYAIHFVLSGAQEVCALDVSKEMLEFVKERAEQLGVASLMDFERADAEKLPLADDRFDVTNCMETFIHLPNPRQALNELVRVTKPGGVVIANVTTGYALWQIRYHPTLKGKLKIIRDRILGSVFYSKACSPIRPFLCRRLHLPPKASEFFSPHFVTNYSEKEFRSIFSHARLRHFKTVREGPWYSPVSIILAAMKF